MEPQGFLDDLAQIDEGRQISKRRCPGHVVLKLKTPWRDGTTHLVMSSLESMKLHTEWPAYGDQIGSLYVCIGSTSDGEAQRQRSFNRSRRQ